MKVHQKVAAVLVSSLGLVAWGCSGDDVESESQSADGIQSSGKAIESGAKSAGEKIKDAGPGTKVEKAANATGNAIEKVGEKIKAGTEKLGEKIKDAAADIGKAVDKAEKRRTRREGRPEAQGWRQGDCGGRRSQGQDRRRGQGAQGTRRRTRSITARTTRPNRSRAMSARADGRSCYPVARRARPHSLVPEPSHAGLE